MSRPSDAPLTPAMVAALRRLRDAGAVNVRTARSMRDLGSCPWPDPGVLERLVDRGLALVFFERHGVRWALSHRGAKALAAAEAAR